MDETTTLDIQYPPYFEEEEKHKNINATEGEENFTISVPFRANPKNMTFNWWRVHQVLGQEERRSIPRHGRVSFSLDGVLNFEKVNQSDQGRYLVEAENQLDITSFEFTLNVLCK